MCRAGSAINLLLINSFVPRCFPMLHKHGELIALPLYTIMACHHFSTTKRVRQNSSSLQATPTQSKASKSHSVSVTYSHSCSLQATPTQGKLLRVPPGVCQ